MKKRISACALALCMACALCACGGDGDAPASPATDQTPPPVPAENTTPPAETQSGDFNEPDYIQEPVEPEPAKPEGLVFLSVIQDSTLQYTYEIYCYNLETKEETALSSFTVAQNAHNPDEKVYRLAFGADNNFHRGLFSSDYSKMALGITGYGTTESHAGWIDTNGTVFDVTEALGLQTKSDFDTPVRYNAKGFAGEMFNFNQHLPDATWQYYYVPVDDVEPSAVHEGNYYSEKGQYNESDHISTTPGNIAGGGSSYYPEQITSWIDDTHCIVNSGSHYGAEYKSLILDIETLKTTKYIPGDSRYNWNGVLSPDGTRIAFMSSPKALGGSTDIYIVPVEGGEPVKVTDLPYELANAEFSVGGPSKIYGYQGTVLIDWI